MTMLRRYDPWSWLDLHDMLEQNFLTREDEGRSSMGNWLPAVDIKNEEKRYLISVDLPGISPDKVDISIENNALLIKGERKTEAKESKEGYSRVERVSGSFYRRFTLPDDIDNENIKAVSKHGVLEIDIPKKKQKLSRKVEITEKE